MNNKFQDKRFVLNDDSLMPWGVHIGLKMRDVPADYLLHMWDMNKCYGGVKDYIKANLEVIQAQAKVIKDAKDTPKVY